MYMVGTIYRRMLLERTVIFIRTNITLRINMGDNNTDDRLKWKISGTTKQGRVEDPMMRSYFDQEEIKSLRKSRGTTQIKKDSKSSQMLDFIYQVLQECDALQVTEDQVLFEARGRENSVTTNICFGNEATQEEKKDLYTIALLGERENQRKLRSGSHSCKLSKQEQAKQQAIKRNTQWEQEIKEGQQINISETLSEILELSNEQKKQWEENFHKKDMVLNVKIHEGKLSTQKLETEYHSIYCQVGLVSPNRIKKNQLHLEDIRHNSKSTSNKANTNEPSWEESIQLTLGAHNCLAVELWGECTVEEKSKKRDSPKKQPMLVKRLIGQCALDLGRQMKIQRKCCPLLSLSGKETTGTLTLSIELVDKVELSVRGLSDFKKYKLYKSLLIEAIRYQISNFLPLTFISMDPSVEKLCETIAIQLKLSEFEINASRWSYINSVDSFIDSKKELEYGLIILNSKWDSEAHKLDPEEKEELLHNIHRFYKDKLEVVKFLLLKYPPRNEKALTKINEHLGLLLKQFRFLKDRKVLDETEDFRRQIICKFKEGVYRWYMRTDERVTNKKDPLTHVQSLNTFCQHTILFIQMLRKYYPGQNSIVKVDISQIAFATIDPLLAGEIEMCLDKIAKVKHEVSDKLIMSIFSLDRKLKLLLEEKKHIFKDDLELHLDLHSEWFKNFTTMWLNILRRVSVEYVDSVIKVETGLQEEIYGDLNITTSALDIAICLFPSYCFYAKMEEYLDPITRIHFAFQIVLGIQETLIRYVQLMGVKISEIVAKSRQHEFMLTNEMCLILNNIHFVKEYLEEIPRKLETHNSNIAEGHNAGHKMFIALLEEAEECLQHEEDQLLSAILPHFDSQIKKYFKHLNSVLNKPVEDVMTGLMDWLVVNFKVSTVLSEVVFTELLEKLWRQVLSNIRVLMNGKQALSIHYEQILKVLNILFDFFHNGGEGLSYDALKNEPFTEIQRQLNLEMMSSSDLILKCVRGFADNGNSTNKNYGTLTYSTVYYDDREMLETSIMSLKDIINPSFTGKFKPFIEVSIIPKTLNIEASTTKIIKYSNDIFINEALHTPIPRDKIGNVVVKISLNYRDIFGIRDQGYSGAIYVNGESIGHCSSDLGHIINHAENKVGNLIEGKFVFPSTENNENLNILRKRTDSTSQLFIKELTNEEKKEQMLNRYTQNVNTSKKIFPSLLRK